MRCDIPLIINMGILYAEIHKKRRFSCGLSCFSRRLGVYKYNSIPNISFSFIFSGIFMQVKTLTATTLSNLVIELNNDEYTPLALIFSRFHEEYPLFRGELALLPIKLLKLNKPLENLILNYNYLCEEKNFKITTFGDFYDTSFATIGDQTYGAGKSKLESLSKHLQEMGGAVIPGTLTHFNKPLSYLDVEINNLTILNKDELQHFVFKTHSKSKVKMGLGDVIEKFKKLKNKSSNKALKIKLKDMALPNAIIHKINEYNEQKNIPNKFITIGDIQDGGWTSFCNTVSLGPKQKMTLSRHLIKAGLAVENGMQSFKQVKLYR
jgi:hypothetical protein